MVTNFVKKKKYSVLNVDSASVHSNSQREFMCQPSSLKRDITNKSLLDALLNHYKQ